MGIMMLQHIDSFMSIKINAKCPFVLSKSQFSYYDNQNIFLYNETYSVTR